MRQHIKRELALKISMCSVYSQAQKYSCQTGLGTEIAIIVFLHADNDKYAEQDIS